MKLQHAWVYPIVCVFFCGAILMGVLAFLGNLPNTPGLQSLSIFGIQSGSDMGFAYDSYSVGISGVCMYDHVAGKVVLQQCSGFGRTPFYFVLSDILANTTAYAEASSFAPALANYMKAVWALLVAHIAINVVGLVCAVVGIAWSSLFREIAVHLGVLSVVVNLVFSAIATSYGKTFVSKFNKGSGAAQATFGTGAIVLLWVLLAFSYCLFAFITIAIKRRNRDLESSGKGKVEVVTSDQASGKQLKYHSSSRSTLECSTPPPARKPGPRAGRTAGRTAGPAMWSPPQMMYRPPTNIPASAYYGSPPVQMQMHPNQQHSHPYSR